MYDKILLPVAPDSDATRAIPHVASLATQYDATVYVLAAADTMEETLRGARVGSLAKRVETAAQDRVEEVEDRLEEYGIEVVSRVDRGAPHSVILDTIETEGIDLVIMPTHTRTGIQRLLLGSVTEKVVRSSPVPVITVPMGEE